MDQPIQPPFFLLVCEGKNTKNSRFPDFLPHGCKCDSGSVIDVWYAEITVTGIKTSVEGQGVDRHCTGLDCARSPGFWTDVFEELGIHKTGKPKNLEM